MTPDELQAFGKAIGKHLARIGRYFKPGTKVTLLVRTPDDPEADFVLSNDDLAEVTKMVWRRRQAAAKNGVKQDG